MIWSISKVHDAEALRYLTKCVFDVPKHGGTLLFEFMDVSNYALIFKPILLEEDKANFEEEQIEHMK